jgi:hypothetical protein
MRRLFWLIVWACWPVAALATSSGSPFSDGTLLFLENCNSVVEYTTRGEIAHVALVFRDGGEPWVYEATPGKVRRVTVEDYFIELARLNQRRAGDDQIRAFALLPKAAYTDEEVGNMRSHLDQQLGRRYSVKNYVRGKPYDGIHCAELASSTLNQSGRYAFAECHKLNPQALYAAILPTHTPPELVAIPPLESQEPWRQRVQRSCTGWFNWCRWSCREAWLWCW